MYIVTPEIMRKLDKETITGTGIPGAVLMENAGRGLVQHIIASFPDLGKGRVAIVAGKGNNGGDGFVAARYLTNAGIPCKVFLLALKDAIRGDALLNLKIIEKMDVPIAEVTSSEGWKEIMEEVECADLVIDAIFGTGLNSEVEGLPREVIEDLNGLVCPKVAVDVPSGLHAGTGRIMGACVKADLTVTMGLPKIGHLIHPGMDYTGRLKVVDISLPRDVIEREKIPYHLVLFDELPGMVRTRRANSHKGTYGHLLVLAGSPGKTGAAALTSEAGSRIGAGLVTLGIAGSLNPIMETRLTEVMTEPFPDNDRGFLGIEAWEAIREIVPGKTALALGPGISTRGGTAALVFKVLEETEIPMVIDADGINCLAIDPAALKAAKAPVVLTPHPGEMARLLKTSVRDVQEERVGTARSFAVKYGAYLVLKGARTIIAEPDGNVYINPTGNAGMASGGVGDALTGMIAGLIAQGYPVGDACRLAVFAHGLIADVIAAERGGIGILAGDIIEEIPWIMGIISRGERSETGTPWHQENLW